MRLGECFDLCDPENVDVLKHFHGDLTRGLRGEGVPLPRNYRQHRKLDCAVFNYLYSVAEQQGRFIDSARGVFVPVNKARRVWRGSWIYEETHIQICIRNPRNIIAVWHVRQDGSYGID